jgi:hypothetical protein
MPAQGKKTAGFWIGAAVIALVTVAAVIRWLYTLPERTNEAQQSAVVVSSSPPGLKNLQVQVWVSDSVIAPGKSVQMAVRFENGTGQDLKGLRVEASEPGFEHKDLVLKSDVLAKNSAMETSAVELKPTNEHGKYRVTVRYWATDTDGLEHEGAVSTPPIMVRDEHAERWYLVYRRVVSLFKDLTLPIVLTVLGLLFQNWQSERDKEAKRQEAKRDDEQRAKEDERDERLKSRDAAEARRQEIWKTILPQFYSLSEEHYLPIVRSLRAMARYRLATPATATADQKNRLLFEFLFLLLRMDILRRKRGQIFFKSRKGEWVASGAWKVLILGSEDALGRTSIDAALGKLTVDITYQQFCFLLSSTQAIKDIQAKFETWLLNPDAKRNFYSHTDLTVIMQKTMYFEANRPFDRDWYEVATKFDLEEPAKYKFPEGPICDDDVKELKKDLTSYLEEVRSYLDSFKGPKI